MKMRLTWYAGVSTALAGVVVLLAFHQRANFYSAMVHLAQSSLSLMILVNLVFIVYASLMYGLQRLLYGPLRPVEIEQLYEKAWFAVTETCLAMTIFREEVGAFFLIMFTALVTGKVWGWIGEGRVDVLEQQPPANPWLFHARLSISLLLSVVYDAWLLRYAVNTVVQQARPTMMVMFLFEFAILTVCSLQTGLRYGVSLVEQRVIRNQTRQRLEERRNQIREQRAEVLRRRETEGAAEGGAQEQAALPSEDDVDEMDIEVPGWQSKGQWVLVMDLVADFVKLGIYTAFFCVLFTFYGLPIHIIRDLLTTTRSFYKKVEALIRYRRAIKEMDLYADATAEELGRENTCIICREEMHVWDPNDPQRMERTRPKKLPCGHILHLGCLKSWLERQQVCPTCRRQVLRDPGRPNRNGDAVLFRINFQLGQNPNRQQGQPPQDGQEQGGADGRQPPLAGNRQRNIRNGVRMFHLGPFRFGFAQGGARDIQEMANRLGLPDDAAAHAPAGTPVLPQQPGAEPVGASMESLRTQIAAIQQRVTRDLQLLQNSAQELQVLNFLLRELARLRSVQQLQQLQELPQNQQPQQMPQSQGPAATAPAVPLQHGPAQPGFGPAQGLPQHPPNPPFLMGQPPPFGALPPVQPIGPFVPRTPATVTRQGASGYGTAISSGSVDLPEGVVIPPGWSLLPLQRVEGGGAPPPVDLPQTHVDQVALLQDMVQRTAGQAQTQNQRNARPPMSRTTSTAATQGSDNGATAAGPSRDLSQACEPRNLGLGDASGQHDARSQDAPPITAPKPVPPNWGGSNQFFGNGTAVTPSDASGAQPDRPAASAPLDGGTAGSSNAAGKRVEVASSTADAGAASSADGETVPDRAHGRGVEDPRGKGKAVSVEEAEDEDG